MLNAFTCDVEDWYQSSYDLNAKISERVYRNTNILLDILDCHETKGTFFVQGMVASQRPEVVRCIAERGHEVASHGYSHKSVSQLSAKEFEREIFLTNQVVEDITGKKVLGYRAPDFSITNHNRQALEILEENGIVYDSSFFPIRMRRYGNPGSPLGTYRVPGLRLIEVPVSLLELGPAKIPVAGGGYVRLAPTSILEFSINKINEGGRPFILYCHPYEFYPNEWEEYEKTIPALTRLHQGLGRVKYPKKVAALIEKFRFGSIKDLLKI